MKKKDRTCCCCDNQEYQHPCKKKCWGLNIMYPAPSISLIQVLALFLFAFLRISANSHTPHQVLSHFNSVTALQSCICPHLLLRAPEMQDPGGWQGRPLSEVAYLILLRFSTENSHPHPSLLPKDGYSLVLDITGSKC